MIRALKTWARRLHGDEAGNVIIVGVAAALLLAARMGALIGVGQRVVQKGALQSSADAAAFSAAVIKAKGLNIIAFCNLVLALLFAVLMLLNITRYLLIGLAAVLTVACFVPGGQAACGPAELVEQAAAQLVSWQQNAETAVRRVMGGLANAE